MGAFGDMISKRKLLLSSVLSIFFFCSSASAIVINDDYWGGDPTGGLADADVIGAFDAYDIDRLTVALSGGNLVVTVYSQFFDNVGRNGIELGDLFISTDGWNPFGAAPFVDDTVNNGEGWELAAVLDDHGEGLAGPTDYTGQSGNLNVYTVIPANIELSALPGSNHRANQEVQYNPGAQQALAAGTWEINEAGVYDELVMTIPVGIFPTSLGFHWTMTCANDVIEGEAQIPEPTSMALLGGALIGGLLCRKRKRV